VAARRTLAALPAALCEPAALPAATALCEPATRPAATALLALVLLLLALMPVLLAVAVLPVSTALRCRAPGATGCTRPLAATDAAAPPPVVTVAGRIGAGAANPVASERSATPCALRRRSVS
jgi:hypothetical protein